MVSMEVVRVIKGPGLLVIRTPAFPRKRLTQLRGRFPVCDLAALNPWAESQYGRIRAGQG